MPLIRFDPFREFDRAFDQALNQARQPSFPMDAYRHGDTIVVHFDLPGVDPNSIDIEYDHQQAARTAFADAEVPANRIRLITGNANEVLPRMNDGAYDLVLVDADAASVLSYVEHGLRIARRGGLVLVARALWKGRVADPAQRDDTVADFRALLATINESGAVQASLIASGDGLLQLVKLSD